MADPGAAQLPGGLFSRTVAEVSGLVAYDTAPGHGKRAMTGYPPVATPISRPAAG